MGNNNIQIFNDNTQIVMGIKSFIGILIFVLSTSLGIYKMFIVPQLDKHDRSLEKIQEQLIEVNTNIGILNGNIQGINDRLKDINQNRNNTQASGGFGVD